MDAKNIRTSAQTKAGYHHGDLRKALLDVAELELAEKGVEGFTLRGCAKRAGVSHAAPAHHFRDANALLSELAAEGFARFSHAMRRRQALSEAEPRATLISAGLGYIDFARANPALFGLMFSSSRPDFSTEPLQSSATAAFGVLVASIAALRDDDPLASPAGMQDVSAAWAIVHGLANLLLSERVPLLKAIGDQDMDAFLTGIITRAVPVRI